MKIIEVYQAVYADTEGRPTPKNTFYPTYHLAILGSDAMGGNPKPIARKALLLDDGKIWVLSERGPCTLYQSAEEVERELALAKLTDKEKVLLGLKP